MTTEGVSLLQRKKVNDSLGAFIEKQLSKEVSKILGPGADLPKVALLTAAIKNNLRSKLGSALGILGGENTGELGGSAGGGNTLEAGAGEGAGYVGGVAGKIGGVPSGYLSLGSGLGTRASRPGSSNGSINLGVSSGGGFGVGSEAGFKDSKAELSPSSSSDITDSIFASVDASIEGAGISEQYHKEFKKDLTPLIQEAVQDAINSAFGPDFGFPNAIGAMLLEAEVTMHTQGNWKAYLTVDYLIEINAEIAGVDLTKEPSGPFVFEIEEVEFRGTVVPDRSGPWGGVRKLLVVGGAGGLDTVLKPKNYSGCKFSTVVNDILRESGESISDETHPSFLEKRLEGWQRTEGTATEALDLICEKAGCVWSMLRDGKVWFGNYFWPDVEPSGTIIESDWGDGVITVAPEYATLVPGIRVLGQNVNKVVHKLTRTEYRAELYTNSVVGLLQKVVDRFNKRNVYARKYRCTVTRQNANKTVDVMIDDERMKGRGAAQCSVRTAQPNTVLNVKKGARCQIGWSDGDPSLPYVDNWENGDFLTSTEIGPGGRAAATAGGSVKILLPPLMPFQGTTSLGPMVGVVTIIEPGAGVIESGSEYLLL